MTVPAAPPAPPLPALYETGEVAWLERSAELIRAGRHDELDYAHLSVFLDDVARSERREVKSRLILLVAHLLQWTCQPAQRSRSWQRTVITQRRELEGFLDSQTIRWHAEGILPEVYPKAVEAAAFETHLPPSAFPAACPFTLADIEAFDILAD